MTRLSDKLEAAMKAGTQGEWSVDTVQSDGEYGSGPDAHSGFHVSAIFGPNGETLFDALNSDAAIVNDAGQVADCISLRQLWCDLG